MRNKVKFGDAAAQDHGSMMPTEETPRPPGSIQDDKGTGDVVCGKEGDRWTSQWPYKDTLMSGLPPERSENAIWHRMWGGKPDYLIRVTNLSEDTREPELYELCSVFGPVCRVYVAVDVKTGVSRGFGFVSFVYQSDAENAIANLKGYGFGGEWIMRKL